MMHVRLALQRVLMLLLVALVSLSAAPGAARQATPAATPEATPVAAEEVYTDPSGAFSVPIPVNWTAEPHDGGVRLISPEGDVAVTIAAVGTDDLDAAIRDTWALTEQGSEPEATTRQDVPAAPGIDRSVVVEYGDALQSGQVFQAVGDQVGDTSYVLLLEGDLAAATRRQSQLQVILTGFDISEVTEIDLSGQQPATLTPEMLDELGAYIEETRTQFGIPGVAVAVVQDGEIVYRQGFGEQELGSGEAVTPETGMLIGSVTKPMTTLMMATMVDDGLFAWDTPIVEILPTFAIADPEMTEQLTVRDLVCACTGVPRRDLELTFNADELAPADVIASLATFELFTPVGEAFQYSNQMVATGGYIATLAAGGRLDSLRNDYIAQMQQRVLDPVGMPHTTFGVTGEGVPANHALPHAYLLDGSLTPLDVEDESGLEPILPAGGAWSTVDDLAHFVITALNQGVSPDGERVVSAANLAETWQPQVAVGADTSYGLGWFIDDYQGQTVIHHGGNTIGFTSELAFMPDADLGIVILTNAQGANVFTNAIRVRLFELAFGQEPQMAESLEYAIQQQEDLFAEAADWIGAAPAADDVAPYLGTYVSPALGEVRVTYEEGRLLLDAGEFASEARRTGGGVASVSDFILTDGVMSGLLVTFATTDGQPTLELIDRTGAGNYVFTMEGEAGTSATPVATPVS